MSFQNLKRQSGKSFDKINQELEKLAKPKYDNKEAEEYWSPTVDKAGNGFAIIRFLPEAEGEEIPFVQVWDHGFQGPGGWYIENSLTTIGKDDPVGDYNSKLWAQSSDDESWQRKQARKQKRRLKYHSNIYVVQDSAKPECEGKVFKYKYGKKIFDKIKDAMHPEFEDDPKFNPFDMWEGANFKLKIRKVEGYPNYDKSEFEACGPLSDDDAVLENIYNSIYPLQPILDPKNFKSYEELEKKLYRVLGEAPEGKGNTNTAENKRRFTEEENDKVESYSAGKTAAPKEEDDTPPFSVGDDDDGDLDFFRKIAESE
jgi:hypothetical protein